MTTRLPRFNRAPTVPPMQLTERDCIIIRLVHRHRFLRSSQIVALVDGSEQQLLRRLQLLYHHGFLERPRTQIDSYYKNGSRPIAYGLGNKGGLLLRQEAGVDAREISWSEKNSAVGRMFLEHALLVSEVMVAIELACRARGIRLVTEPELVLPGQPHPFEWRVTLHNGAKLGVIPDRVFALEFPGQNQRVHFFLEADRGTMPVKRRNLVQTSFQRKLLAYEATWAQKIHQRQLGIPRFRVLTVTASAQRVQSLVAACQELQRGHGLFLFADQTILSGDILANIWQTGRPGQLGGPLD